MIAHNGGFNRETDSIIFICNEREREILNFDGFKRAVVDDGSFLLRCIPFVQYSEGDVILEEE